MESTALTYKDLLLKKSYYSVVCSVLSQLTLITVYILIQNLSFLHPVQWLKSFSVTFFSLSTWLCLLPLLLITLAQSMICAKDYAFKPTYCSTRFQKLLAIFSLQNFVLSTLHVVIGGVLVWMFLSINPHDFHEENFCTVLSGLFVGFYFFVKVYVSGRQVLFPVIHQNKLGQFKSTVAYVLKDCFTGAIPPAVFFWFLYYLWGSDAFFKYRQLFNLPVQPNTIGYMVYFYVYLFCTLYYFNMNLMRFFFNLFFTQPVQFPLSTTMGEGLTLQTSINMTEFPVIQSLACSDLKILAQWSPCRRQILFTLSNPGGHPHNWNCLVENILKLFGEYRDLLNKSTENLHPELEVKSPIISPTCNVQSPLYPANKFHNIRNMSFRYEPTNILDISHRQLPASDLPEVALKKIKTTLYNIYNFLNIILGVRFFFGELPQANIQRCLANGQLIIQLSEGISQLIVASLQEDRYGIVQKDLPLIITSLVELKQSLDRLNKVPALTRKIAGFDDFNYKMKGAVGAAVKRSLFNICRNFEAYLNEFPLKKEVLVQLQPFIVKS